VQLIVGRLVTPVKAKPEDIELLIHHAFEKSTPDLEQLTIIERLSKTVVLDSVPGLNQLEMQNPSNLEKFMQNNPELIEVVRALVREEVEILREQLLIDLNFKARESK
jgi:uncharacterized protein with von Willebrand factor type A (vWA) domain